MGALLTQWREDLRQDDAGGDGPGGPWLSGTLVGRAAAVLFVLVGVSSLVSRLGPTPSGGQPGGALFAAVAAAGAGLLTGFLPWGRWPRWAGLFVVPVGLALMALQLALAGPATPVDAVLFVLLFAWIGVALPRGTALIALPLLAVAYLLPPASAGQLSSLTLAAAVDDIGAELASTAHPEDVWSSIAVRLSDVAGLPGCDVYRLNEGGGLVCLASVDDNVPCPDHVGLRPEQDVWAVDGKAVLTKAPLLIASPVDPRLSVAERGDMQARREQAMLIVPLVARGEVVGLVEIGETRESRTISPEKVSTVTAVCRLVAMALHDAGKMQEQEEGERRLADCERRLASLHESSRAVTGAASLEEALAVVTRCAGEALGVTECVAYEYDAQLDAIVMRARWGRTPGGRAQSGEPLPLADGQMGHTVLEAESALLERLSDPALDPAICADLDARGEKTRLTVPMPSADGPVGLLTFGDAERERVFPGEDLAVASALAGLAGEAVAGARLLRRLGRLSEADAMTGLASHRELHESLALEQARAQHHGSHFSAVMIGLDGLKPLNDTYGHPAGDEVLRLVASMLSERTGADDIVGRWAGDEFLVILAETTAARAALFADELRAALAEAPYVTTTGEQVPIRVSIGIAAYPEDALDASGLAAVADADLRASRHDDVTTDDEQECCSRSAGDEAVSGPPAEAGDPQVGAEQDQADEPAALSKVAVQDDGTIDQAEMRKRIEETRTRLKVKAFDAMIRGKVALLARDGDGAPEPTAEEPALGGDLEGMVDGAFSEQEY